MKLPAPKQNPEVILYTDGACSRNPGPGGWAFVLIHPESGKRLESFGADPATTNNRMELQAVIEGLTMLKRPSRVRVVTDSSYVEKGLSQWSPRWKTQGWRRKTSKGYRTVKNVELWQQLDALAQRHQVVMERVRGHSGHPENERCDQLAVASYRELQAEQQGQGQ